MKRRLSAVVVNHNGCSLLADCLGKLTSLPDPPQEIVVVDNGSSDGSVEMTRQRFPKVRLLELEDNLGFGVANNRGAALTDGEFLLFLNSDAWLDDGALERLLSAFDDRPRLGLVAPQLRYPDGSLQFTWVPTTGVLGEALQMARNPFESRPWVHHGLPTLLRPLVGDGWLTAACWLMRRTAFESVGGFDEAIFLYFEDVDLSLRLRRRGWRLRLIPQATAFHIKGASDLGFRGEMLYRRSQLYYYRKHRPRWENALLRRRLVRKFRRHADAEQRRRLLALLDESISVSPMG